MAVLHFPGSRHVMDVTVFTNEPRLFVLSALHHSQVQSTFFYHNAFFFFFPLLFITNLFSPITAEKAPAKGEFCSKSHKRSYLSAVRLRLMSFCGQAP